MPDHRPTQDQITECLQASPASAPKSASALRESAHVVGHSWRGLQRAAERLQLPGTRIGMADGWLWSLPTPAVEGDISNGIFGGRPTVPVLEAVTCLTA